MSNQQKLVMEERFTARASQPFQPEPPSASGTGLDVDATLRMAHALEYIAAQLGQINAKLDALVSGLARPRQKE
jgi:hypothetical protein